MNRNLLLGTVLLLGTSQCFAGGWSVFTKITEVYPHDSGAIFFKAESMENLDGCERVSYIKVASINESKDRIYSALLAAMTANQVVSYNMLGCDSYPLVRHVRVRPSP